ncbi:MAG: hypothetical protein JSW58_02180, partial [Candidatus Latescibacterota bacterium]
MSSKFEEEDLRQIRPITIGERKSKVGISEFVDPENGFVTKGSGSMGQLIDGFPKILKGDELRRLIDALRRARDGKKEILWLIGAHVIKCGLSLYVNSLVQNGFVTALSTTGSATVHDLELA